MMYIAICDDEECFRDQLRSIVEDYMHKNNIPAEIKVYSQSRNLRFDIEEGQNFDLILSDIVMPVIDGMKLGSYIRRNLPDTLLIFITSHLRYSIDGYELSAFRFIPKNRLEEKLNYALADAVKLIESRSDQFYYIDTPNRKEKVLLRNVVQIKRAGKNAVFVMTDERKISVRKSLSHLMKEMSAEEFVYVDRGNIINLRYVRKIKETMVELEDETQLWTSASRLEEVKQKLSRFWSKMI